MGEPEQVPRSQAPTRPQPGPQPTAWPSPRGPFRAPLRIVHFRVGPLRAGAFRSSLHDERTASLIGITLGSCFGTAFVTGLISHLLQHPPAGGSRRCRSTGRGCRSRAWKAGRWTPTGPGAGA